MRMPLWYERIHWIWFKPLDRSVSLMPFASLTVPSGPVGAMLICGPFTQ